MYWNVLRCSGIFCGMSMDVACSGMYCNVLGCTGMFLDVLGNSGIFGMFWDVLGCTGIYWDVLGCTGVSVTSVQSMGSTKYRANLDKTLVSE